MPDGIQDQIYRPSVEEAGNSVDIEFKNPQAFDGGEQNGSNEIVVDVEAPSE